MQPSKQNIHLLLHLIPLTQPLLNLLLKPNVTLSLQPIVEMMAYDILVQAYGGDSHETASERHDEDYGEDYESNHSSGARLAEGEGGGGRASDVYRPKVRKERRVFFFYIFFIVDIGRDCHGEVCLCRASEEGVKSC